MIKYTESNYHIKKMIRRGGLPIMIRILKNMLIAPNLDLASTHYKKKNSSNLIVLKSFLVDDPKILIFHKNNFK